ncbi:MAG TPA: condensation domain-containing protein, partial [Kineosporiaceae bacterium]|nr:condensation domain-containing protein [Kineosporiaceae bacterium]
MDTSHIAAAALPGYPDRRALLAADPEQRRQMLAEFVRSACARLTGRPIGDEPDLFLESLQATELQILVESQLEIELSLLDLVPPFGIDDLVTVLDDALASGPARSQVPVVVPEVSGRFEPFGLTDVQHAYWLGRSGLFDLGDVSTHVFLEFESVGFDVPRVESVLSRLVERHDMLRAVIRSDGRQQVLADVPQIRVAIEDLTGCSEAEQEHRVQLMRERLSHEVRPSEVWPLFEVSGQLLASGLTRVYLSLDLLIADAASIRLLLAEFATLFENPDTVLTPLELTFRDYVSALAGVESGENFDRARAYWSARVVSLPAAPQLPVVPAEAGVATRFVRRSGGLDVVRWEGLRVVAGRWGVTVSAVLLAAYAEVLGVWSKSSRFTVNVTVGDRLPVHSQVEGVVGDFTSLVLVEVDGLGVGFGERVRRVQEQLWRDLEHRAFGGVRVLRELAQVRGPVEASMPVVFTSALGAPMPGRDGVLPGLGRFVGGVSQTPQVFLDYQVFEQAGSLVVSWDAVEAVFEPGVLDAMFGAHQALLERLVDEPQLWERPGSAV